MLCTNVLGDFIFYSVPLNYKKMLDIFKATVFLSTITIIHFIIY